MAQELGELSEPRQILRREGVRRHAASYWIGAQFTSTPLTTIGVQDRPRAVRAMVISEEGAVDVGSPQAAQASRDTRTRSIGPCFIRDTLPS